MESDLYISTNPKNGKCVLHLRLLVGGKEWPLYRREQALKCYYLCSSERLLNFAIGPKERCFIGAMK
jgi:hypothetical protein